MERKIKFSWQRRISFLTIMAASCLFIAFASPANAVNINPVSLANGEWQNGYGDITYDFAGYLDIWDISGTYFDSLEIGGVQINYVITQDASGKLTGNGNASYGDVLNMSFDVKGTVGTKNGDAWVKMTLKGKGTVLYEGEPIKFSFSEKVNAQVNPDSRTITGDVAVRVSTQGHSESTTVPFDVTLPADMNGLATLSLSCNSSGDSRFGTGEVTLSNGESYHFDVKGKYNANADESTLTLKGSTKGSSLKLKVDGSDGTIKTLKGKMLGQKLNAINIAP